MVYQYQISGFAERVHAALSAVAMYGGPKPIEIRAYETEYLIILDWFASQEGHWTGSLVRLGGLIIYGWMPTILRAEGRDGQERNVDFEEVAIRLNQENIGEDNYRFLNGSVVGTSKFLHFWKPGDFAIWDRTVRVALGQPSRGDALGQYKRYLSDIREYVSSHDVTMREIEFALFQHGQMSAE